MDDLQFGTRNKRGDWSPNARPQIAFFWKTPFHVPKWVTFLIGYIWPWNAFHMAVTLLYWNFLLPDWEKMKTLSWDWALWLYFVNSVGIFIMYGSIEFFYYWKRSRAPASNTITGSLPTSHQTFSGSKARTSTTSCGLSSCPSRFGR